MTLVVARIRNDRIAVVADTRVTIRDAVLPMTEGTLKSICLPGGLCVSYTGSPELAKEAFASFRRAYPDGLGYADTLTFFETSSKSTNNDYILAFASPAKLVTIRDGRRTSGVSSTHWIGDRSAYERFRENEHSRRQYERGRAVPAVIFADEIEGSPASDLYSVMRSITSDPSQTSVGGFITVLGNREGNFRYSVYCDVLLDWPLGVSDESEIRYDRAFDLRSSGENDRYSISQISGGYYGLNAVAFYALSGRLLVVHHEAADGQMTCQARRGIEPNSIAATIDEMLGWPFRAMCLIMSARRDFPVDLTRTSENEGMAMSLFCEANTMPRVSA